MERFQNGEKSEAGGRQVRRIQDVGKNGGKEFLSGGGRNDSSKFGGTEDGIFSAFFVSVGAEIDNDGERRGTGTFSQRENMGLNAGNQKTGMCRGLPETDRGMF
jgi:hypothetical protein